METFHLYPLYLTCLNINSDNIYIDYIMLTRLIKSSTDLCLKTKRQFSELKKFENNFLNATSIVYIESLYQRWLEDKNSVSPSFAAYFHEL